MQVVLPLVLAQFIASYAASNMNVAISNIAADIGTTVIGVQTAITLFTLVMAALMIPGSKLTDIWGRKFCLILGLGIYGVGGLIATVAPSLLVLSIGYSLLEGIGSALLIPPIYILLTVLFSGRERAKNFGLVSAAAGMGSAAGPLIGGLITTAITWRASFLLQVLVVGLIIIMSRGLPDSGKPATKPNFDFSGATLSAAGLVLIVVGILESRTYGWLRSQQAFSLFGHVIIPKGGLSPIWLYIAAGLLFLAWFYRHIEHRERTGRTPLVATHVLHNVTANLGLITQNIQWLVLQGSSFVVSVFLQTVRGFNAIETGLSFTPATVGLLLSSALAGRMAVRRAQATLIRGGFALTVLGLALLVILGGISTNVLLFIPGLFALGLGVGIMLTASVNVVQSSFSEKDQGEISGVSRSVSNLGSSFGTSIVGSVLVSSLVAGNRHFVLAIIVMLVFGVIGLLVAFALPKTKPAISGTGN